MMDIRQILYFVALYEEGSITKAAKRMHVVQPAISQQLKRLEINSGVRLFERDAHGTTPTPLAHDFYRRCLSVLAEMELARKTLNQGAENLSGKVVVGAQASFNQFAMPVALEGFHESHPSVEITARNGYRCDLIEWLNQGELDFAILSTTKDLLSLKTLDLSREELIVVGHSDTLSGCAVLQGSDLTNFKLVLPSPHKSMRTLIDAQFGTQGLVLRPRMQIDSMQSLLLLALRPGWISIVPRSTISGDAFGGNLKCVPLEKPKIIRNVVAAWSNQRAPNAFMEAFVSVFKQTLASIPGVVVVEP